MLRFRRAVPDDCVELQSLSSDIDAVWALGCAPFETAQWWRDKVTRAASNGLFVVAVHEDRVIAYIELYVDTLCWVRRHVATIGLCVHEDYRGQGVGSELLQNAVEWASDWLGLTRLELFVWADHAPAIALYESQGFLREGVHESFGYSRGRHATAISMGKVLVREPQGQPADAHASVAPDCPLIAP